MSSETPASVRRYFTKTPSILNIVQKKLDLPLTEEAPRFHLDPDVTLPLELPERYVVFCCQSLAKHRQWQISRWKELALHVIGRGIDVIECGIAPTLCLDSPRYHTLPFGSIQITAKVISRAEAAVGVESGLMHLANALGIFGFVITGRLHHMPEYNYYSGEYSTGTKCNMLRLYGLSPFHVPVELVRVAMDTFFDGHPLTPAECDLMCLKYLIERYQNKGYVKFFEAVPELFLRLAMILQFHRRPRLPKTR